MFDAAHCHAVPMHVPDTSAALTQGMPGGLFFCRDGLRIVLPRNGTGDLAGCRNAFRRLFESDRCRLHVGLPLVAFGSAGNIAGFVQGWFFSALIRVL